MLGLVTCDGARDLDADLPLLLRRLPEARIEVWTDPDVDWGRFDVVIVRSTWDYHERRDQFLQWARQVEAVSTLWNPIGLIEWNTDKRYLLDLARRDVPVVPTRFAELGEAVELEGDLVIKPSVGAGSNGVLRTRGDEALARRHISALQARALTPLIQPYLAGIEEVGETDLVFLGGEYSHAICKGPILTGSVEFEEGLYAEERVEPHDATPVEIEIGRQVVAQLPPTAYARVDLLPTDGGPVVLEVEVTEPSLYLNLDDGAAARAAAVFRSLAP